MPGWCTGSITRERPVRTHRRALDGEGQEHMRDLAPDIVRQRLLIEGLYRADVDQAWVERFLTGLAAHLQLRSYASPIAHSPGGAGKDAHQGYDAFLPLIASGISLYV